MKRLFLLAASLMAAVGVWAQPAYGDIYRPATLNDVTAVSIDIFALLYGYNTIDQSRSLAEEGLLQTEPVQTAINATAAMAFQFNPDCCRVVIPKGANDYGLPLYDTYTFAYASQSDSLTVALADGEQLLFIVQPDSSVRMSVGLGGLNQFGLIDDKSAIIDSLGCDDLIVDVMMSPDDGWSLANYIAPAPFTMRYLTTSGFFYFVDYERSSTIRAIYTSEGLTRDLLTLSDGVVVVFVGNDESCPPCNTFNSLALLPAVEDWLTIADVGNKALITYIDVAADNSSYKMLCDALGCESVPYPSVFFISGGREVAPRVVGCADDAAERLKASLRTAIGALDK